MRKMLRRSAETTAFAVAAVTALAAAALAFHARSTWYEDHDVVTAAGAAASIVVVTFLGVLALAVWLMPSEKQLVRCYVKLLRIWGMI